MDKVACPQCGELYTRPGLVGHMRFKHRKELNAPLFESIRKPYITELQERVAHLEQQLNNNSVEGNMDDVMTRKDYEIEKLREQLASMKSGKVAVADTEDDDAPVSRKDMLIQKLQDENEAMRNGHTHFDPDIYERCPGCGPDFKAFKERVTDQVVAELSKGDIRKLAEMHDMRIGEFLPDTKIKVKNDDPAKEKLVANTLRSVLNMRVGQG